MRQESLAASTKTSEGVTGGSKTRRRSGKTSRPIDAEPIAGLLQTVADIFAVAGRFDEGAEAVLRATCQFMHADYGGLWLMAEQSGQLRCEATWHAATPGAESIPAINSATTLVPPAGLPTAARATGQPQWTNSPLAAGGYNPGIQAMSAGLGHAYSAPVPFGDQVIGVLEFHWPQSTRPGTQSLPVVGLIAPLLARFIKRTQQAQTASTVLGAMEIRTQQALIEQLYGAGGHLQVIVDQMPAGVIVAEAPTGRIILASKETDRILGRPLLPLGESGQYAGWRGFHADGRRYQPGEWPMARAILTGEVVVNEEIEIERADGKRAAISENAAPIRDAHGNIVAGVVIGVDITGRKAAERALQAALSRTRELYETSKHIGKARTLEEVLQVLMSNGYLADSTCASIVVFDRPWTEESHLPAEMEVAASWDRTGTSPVSASREFPTDTQWLLAHVRESFMSDVQTDRSMGSRLRDYLLEGNTRSLAVFPLIASGEWFGILNFHFDVTRAIAAEGMRHIQGVADQASVAIHNLRLFEAEARARREAERANALRLQFLAMISHELRTPLTSIKGFITTLLADDVTWDPANQRDFLATADVETDRLHNLIEQLLDLSQLEAGLMRIYPEEQQLMQIVSGAWPRLQRVAGTHPLVLAIHDDLAPVRVDGRRIEQVLTNLIDNAAKYSPDRSPITLSACRHGSMLQVDVSDQGTGMTVDERSYVFDAFRRGRDENAKRVSGAGLGLAICRGIVQAHGGQIWIAGDVPLGTTLSFTLPTRD